MSPQLSGQPGVSTQTDGALTYKTVEDNAHNQLRTHVQGSVKGR